MFELLLQKDDIQFKELRHLYLDSLWEPQELFLELIVRKSNIYLISDSNSIMGYFILSNDIILTEFYIKDEHVANSESIFKQILENFTIKTGYCKSFDHLLLKNCMAFKKDAKIIGTLFRDIIFKPKIRTEFELTNRFGNIQDFNVLSEFKDGVFENDEELKLYLENENLIVFLSENTIVGFGIFSLIIDGRPDFDIGMAIHPDFRQKKFGSKVIQFMRDYCIKNKWRPVCGCAVDNIGSIKCLENAGFISKYCLIEFVF